MRQVSAKQVARARGLREGTDRRGALLPGIAVCLLVSVVLLALPSCRKPDTGNRDPGAPTEGYVLCVRTDPPGAAITVDGRHVGASPLDGIVLDGEGHTVTAVIDGLEYRHALAPSPHELQVIYILADPRTKGFARYEVVSAEPGADVWVRGAHVGKTPFALHVAVPDVCRVSAQAPGSMVEVATVQPHSGSAACPLPLALTLPPGDGEAGPIRAPDEERAPVLSWVAPYHCVFEAPVQEVCVGSEGEAAVVLEHSSGESIYLVEGRLDARPAGVSHAVSWRTRDLVWSYGYARSTSLIPVGWTGGKLLFLAPEPAPGEDRLGLLGIGLWEVGDRQEPRRLAWWPHWSTGMELEGRWITADGRAAVIHVRSPEASSFYVVDLGTGASRVVTAEVPVYEPANCDTALPSPDGWSLAWKTRPPGVSVVVLDLRDGSPREVYVGGPDVLGDIQWSPDSSMLAIAHASPDEDHFIVHGEDGSVLYPSRFVVVGADGGMVAEVAVPGEILGTDLAWSPEADMVAVWAMLVRPLEHPMLPDLTHDAYPVRLYAGSLGHGRVLDQVWEQLAPGDAVAAEVRYCRTDFLVDGALALSLFMSDGSRVLMVLDAEALQGEGDPGFRRYDGYEVTADGRGRFSGGAEAVPRSNGVLLYSRQGGLHLLPPGPDQEVVTLIPGGSHGYAYDWQGQYLVVRQMEGHHGVFLLDLVHGGGPD